jgi:transcriptional regulator with XRE-family HTH domain
MERKEDVLRKFGKQLTALRIQKKMSIRELAIATGLEPVRLRKIEAGLVNLSFTTILSLARGLGTDPHELLSAI